ncbi:MAG TPA: hypothetical protein VHE53_05795 [Patescibacteria group bacterium]|nr:hypothetical protein [Patescibacteria group bacterium]
MKVIKTSSEQNFGNRKGPEGEPISPPSTRHYSPLFEIPTTRINDIGEVVDTRTNLPIEYYPTHRDREGGTYDGMLSDIKRRVEAFAELSPKEQAERLRLAKHWDTQRLRLGISFKKIWDETDIDRTHFNILRTGLLSEDDEGRRIEIARMNYLFGEPSKDSNTT